MNEYLTKIMLYHQVHEKDQEGVSITKIAEQTQLNWRTVKRLLALNEKEFLESIEQKGRRKTLSDYGEFVKEKLIKHPDTSAAQMFDWLKEQYPDLPPVSIKTIFNFVLAIRRKYNIPKEATLREYEAVPELPYGLQAQVDFGFYNLKTTLGKTKKVQFFTFLLSRSRYKFLFFKDTPFTTADVIVAHEKAFEYLGGCPGEMVYDQDRLFMVSENLGEIILTSAFREYVKQSSFTTHFCRKADPESKGKVENVVKYVKQNFLYNRSFKNIETLNEEALDWLKRTGNALPHGTTKKKPSEEFILEKDFLAPWYPALPQPAKYPAYAVRKDNTISWKSNLYSVPRGTFQGSGTEVWVKVEGGQLILLDKTRKELCRHPIHPLKGQKILQSDHARNKENSIAENMQDLAGLLENKEKALEWLSWIKKDKPRYIRDQIQLLKTTITELDADLANQTFQYCYENKIVSAIDFKAVAQSFKRKQEAQNSGGRIILMNPLNGIHRIHSNAEPLKSQLSTYETLFNKT